MRLSTFIFANMESILVEWEQFARTVVTPVPILDQKGLRNHAQQMLHRVASDMRKSQTAQEQIDKSQGRAPPENEETPAQTHAVLRLIDGFTLDQMVSEYRALRSTVLRLWLAEAFSGESHQMQDMIRFNEAIDQALVESIASYGRAVETTRKMVLGVLGHDLRSPLGAIMMSAELLQQSSENADRRSHLTTQIGVSVRRANQIVDDLLDLARSNLGHGIPVTKQKIDLSAVCQSILAEAAARFPSTEIALTNSATVVGEFDPLRIGQAFSNLVNNAVQHGDRHQPIRASLKMAAKEVHFTVHNFGDPIPKSALPFLFTPEGRYSSFAENEDGPSAGLGLGLFIAAEVVKGHGGEIGVESSLELGTTFTVTLPLD
ncbi:sensor histidine kinase [Pseudomonas putida]|uniref:histidine kinase n=1 Tax=Pseudomonas putida TaxID=303 RepID=A0A2C5W718_PSEPU|nr:HAMP domain-containing sensor histidine kinase [Pseudomonas putida]PHH39751.1 two-component sensor histidine kinase [Pseudomonas putida]